MSGAGGELAAQYERDMRQALNLGPAEARVQNYLLWLFHPIRLTRKLSFRTQALENLSGKIANRIRTSSLSPLNSSQHADHFTLLLSLRGQC
eukprot:7913046-Heterocapsa_arctica.AAC.1